MPSGPLGVVDVGGSHLTAALVASRGTEPRVLRRRSAALDSGAAGDEILDALDAAVGDLRGSTGSWTFALPGPFDYERGVGTFEGVAKFDGLSGVDLRAELAARLALPTDRIAFLNDAVAYAVGEWSASGSGPDRFVCVTLGTGVGSAFLLRGRAVTTGPEVPPDGWVHRLRVAGRPLEESVSTAAIRRDFRAVAGEDADVADIARRARRGDPAARTVLDGAMRRLGEVLGPWLRRFGADDLVVGGAMARSWDLLGPALSAGLAGSAPDVPVRPAVALDDAPLLGAAVWRSEATG